MEHEGRLDSLCGKWIYYWFNGGGVLGGIKEVGLNIFVDGYSRHLKEGSSLISINRTMIRDGNKQ